MDRAAILRRIDAIEQLLADMRADLQVEDELEEDSVEIPRQGTWRRRMLADLYPNIEHRPGVMALLDVAAENSPNQVPYGQVRARSGLSDRDQRNDHAALSTTTARLFPAKTWPLECWQASEEMMYRMPVKIAAWWQELRREHLSGPVTP
jgi:hypothetical protein